MDEFHGLKEHQRTPRGTKGHHLALPWIRQGADTENDDTIVDAMHCPKREQPRAKIHKWQSTIRKAQCSKHGSYAAQTSRVQRDIKQ
jgi:hypothetical protein